MTSSRNAFLISLVAALLFTAFETVLFYTLGMGHVDLTTVGLSLFFSWPILLVIWPHRLIVNLSLFGGQTPFLKTKNVGRYFFLPVFIWMIYFAWDLAVIEPQRINSVYLPVIYLAIETAAFFLIRRLNLRRVDTRSASA